MSWEGREIEKNRNSCYECLLCLITCKMCLNWPHFGPVTKSRWRGLQGRWLAYQKAWHIPFAWRCFWSFLPSASEWHTVSLTFCSISLCFFPKALLKVSPRVYFFRKDRKNRRSGSRLNGTDKPCSSIWASRGFEEHLLNQTIATSMFFKLIFQRNVCI